MNFAVAIANRINDKDLSSFEFRTSFTRGQRDSSGMEVRSVLCVWHEQRRGWSKYRLSITTDPPRDIVILARPRRTQRSTETIELKTRQDHETINKLESPHPR